MNPVLGVVFSGTGSDEENAFRLLPFGSGRRQFGKITVRNMDISEVTAYNTGRGSVPSRKILFALRYAVSCETRNITDGRTDIIYRKESGTI